MKRNYTLTIVGIATMLGIALPFVATAAVPIINIGNPATHVGISFDEAHGNNMIGWNFNVTAPVTITQVGWYDAGQDGLSRAFQIGLWKGDYTGSGPLEQLLGVPATGIEIPGGTVAALQGVWRVIDLKTPITLTAGQYQLAGLDSATTTDPIRYLDGNSIPNASVDPAIQMGNFFYQSLGNPTFGPSSNGSAAYGVELGPMLFSVPEPSGVGCLLLAMLVCQGPRTRKRG